MLMKKFLAFLFIFFFGVVSSLRAEKTEADVRNFLNEKGQKLIITLGSSDLEEKYDILDEMFENNVDVDYIARFVMGQYYRNMTDEQKKKYHELFKRYIVSLYKSYPLDFETKGLGFEISAVKKNGKYFDASTIVDLPEKYQTEAVKKVSVDFKLTENNGQFQLVDLKIGEVSMIVTLRNRFSNMIKEAEEEIDWFLEDFEDLTKSNEENVKL